LLAAGFVDAVVEAGLKPHDVAALIPIIESAGGRITTWDNKSALQGGRILATGDQRVHREALSLLN
jgi:myo-inositol-1(or 4)-monophosphatase